MRGASTGPPLHGFTDLQEKRNLSYRTIIGPRVYRFDTLRDLLAKATPLRSGDSLAGLAGLAAARAPRILLAPRWPWSQPFLVPVIYSVRAAGRAV